MLIQKFRILLLIFLFFSQNIHCVVAGSDSAVEAPQARYYFPATENSTNKIANYALMDNGFYLQDSTTSCSFSSVFPIASEVDLRGGKLLLSRDLVFSKNTTLTNSAIIGGEGFTIFLNSDFEIPEYSLIKFISDTAIDGQGHDLILGHRAQLLIDSEVTLTLRNLTLKNSLNTISQPPIRCLDWYSKIAFDNVKISLNDDFAFRIGQFFIHNDVEFTGTSKFSYRSVCPSYVTQDSNLIFDHKFTFEYYPSTIDKSLIKIQDQTSRIFFDGATLQTTHTGIRLTKGSLYFDNKVTLSGASQTAYADMTSVDLLPIDITNSVAWSPDGRYLATGCFGRNKLLRLDGGNLTEVFSTLETDSTESIAWSPDGRYLATGNWWDQVNRLYRLDGESLTHVFSTSETDTTHSVAWSPDGRYLAVGNFISQSNRLYRLDGESLTLVDSTSEEDSTHSIAWSSNGRYLAAGYGAGIRLYRLDVESLSLVYTATGISSYKSVAWSPNGRYLVGGFYGKANELYRLDGESLTFVDSTSEEDYTYSVAWSPDGMYLAVGNFLLDVDRLYRLDGENLTLVDSTSEEKLTCSVAWSPDGRYLLIGVSRGNLYRIYYKFDTSPQGSPNSIVFSDSSLGSDYDLNVYLFAGAQVEVYGCLDYENGS